MLPQAPKRPLVAIVGATGTGKSELAVALAEQCNGEIINGDALQMYEGLPISTNKIPVHEQRGVRHHLLGCVKLGEEPWTVRQFHERATDIIDEIRSRDKLPILVGGTHYYTQSLLSKDSLVEESTSEHLSVIDEAQIWPILNASTEAMLKELRKVDPKIADRWHPNDRRKIRRSLEIWLQTGKQASAVYEEQSSGGTCTHSGEVDRFYAKSSSAQDVLLFWTYSSSEILNARLDKRVDGMISAGLVSEVQSMEVFLRDQEQRGIDIDQSRGIWVAIGFKEFLPYVRGGATSEDALRESIERTKIATRQYAKRQVRWIRLKLFQELRMANRDSTMFLLDATDVSDWSTQVEIPAKTITTAFLSGHRLPVPGSLSESAGRMLVTEERHSRSAKQCTVCNKTLMSDVEWARHEKSKGHRSAIRPKIDWQSLYPKKESEMIRCPDVSEHF